ncbi:MAG TPA: SDR family oxidoreductase [Caulobacteraceae bacterium]|jgi:NAD(P)-dependent dehydrogenase (short-subunit alcohol dehydrogenase family)|nr:SDR family oxidoreductase [Caulobacteraceae bacterium]
MEDDVHHFKVELRHAREVITGVEAAAWRTRLMGEAGWPLFICDLNGERLGLAAALDDREVGSLIHCAGLSPSMAELDRILDVNLAATMRLVDTARPRMAEGAAAVLFSSLAGHMLGTALDEPISKVTTPEAVASLSAYTPDTGAAYSVSKRGVVLLVRREALGFGRRGARIVSLSPGCIDTPMGRAEMETQPIMKVMIDNSALPRLARPEEVAAVAVFLCSTTASFVTGTDFLVDGGVVGGSAPPRRA